MNFCIIPQNRIFPQSSCPSEAYLKRLLRVEGLAESSFVFFNYWNNMPCSSNKNLRTIINRNWDGTKNLPEQEHSLRIGALSQLISLSSGIRDLCNCLQRRVELKIDCWNRQERHWNCLERLREPKLCGFLEAERRSVQF